MQLLVSLSVASAMVATVSAASAIDLNKACDLNRPHIKITNNCPYTVYLWSVIKTEGCPASQMYTLPSGGLYNENLQWPPANAPDTGISIKLSKTQTCGGADISQMEYYLNGAGAYGGNYLDMSFIDCPGGNCPGLNDGYQLTAGNQTGKWTASNDNKWCPSIKCTDKASCSLVSYMLPDDPQTRTCDVTSNMDLTLCGGSPASNNPSSAPANTPAASKPATSPVLQAHAAAITPAAEIKADTPKKNVKTEVVYVTAYQTVNAKRHIHGHARRHARYHA